MRSEVRSSAPPPPPPSVLRWGGLCTRAAIGSGPGGGRGAEIYKNSAAQFSTSAFTAASLVALGSQTRASPASHGDQGCVRAEGRRPGAGHHPLRAEGKGRGRGRRRDRAAHLCSGAGGRPGLGPPSPRPRRAWPARPRSAGPLPCGCAAPPRSYSLAAAEC